MAVNAAAGRPGIAGVIGLAIAFRLAREGRDVLLIDPREPGRAASYGNAGHIATEQIVPLASPHTIRRAPALLLKPDSPLFGATRIRLANTALAAALRVGIPAGGVPARRRGARGAAG